MSQRPFSIASLPSLDNGRAALSIDFEIARCIADIQERPNDTQKRVVAVNIELEPIQDARHGLSEIGCKVKAQAKLPTQASPQYKLLPQARGGKASFSEGSPYDPRQMTLDEAGDHE